MDREITIKNGETEITMNEQEISVSAPKIVEEPKMLFTPEDSSGAKYSPESIGIPCPIADRE